MVTEPLPRPTRRQREVYEFIVLYLGRHGYQPSVRDIMLEFSFRSPNTVTGVFDALEREGWIKRTGDSRALKLLRHRVIVVEKENKK